MEGLTEVLYQLGDFANRRARVAEAGHFLEKALEMAQALGNPHQQIRALLKLSSVAYQGGDTALAERRATAAIRLARDAGLENLSIRGLIDLGNVLLIRGEYQKAEEYLKEALGAARRWQNRRLEAGALFTLGNLGITRRQPEGALQMGQALAFYRQAGFRKEAGQALILLGRYRRNQGDYDGALNTFQQQLALAQEASDSSQAALAHEGIGSVLLREERYPEAYTHFKESYTASQTLGNQIGVGYGSLQCAGALWRLGQYNQANEMLEVAIAVAVRPGGYDSLLASIHECRAEIALSQRQFHKAVEWSRKSIALSGIRDAATSAEAQSVLSLAWSLSGARAEGTKACETATDLASRVEDAWLLSRVRLACAEVALQTGHAQGALTAAVNEVQKLERFGQLDSRWRALLIAHAPAESYVMQLVDASLRVRRLSSSLLWRKSGAVRRFPPT